MDHKFVLDIGWKLLIRDMGINLTEVLKRAQLPEGLFADDRPELTTDQYFRVWEGMDATLEDPNWPLQLAQHVGPEVFNPPLFAALCSPNLEAAMQRLSDFKKLCGPMLLPLESTDDGLRVHIEVAGSDSPFPAPMIATELVFLVHLARMATRERITPLQITATMPLQIAYTDFFGIQPQRGKHNSLHFSAEDLALPFLTENASMWEYFEPELRKRLNGLEAKSSFTHRVRSVLLELLPSGDSSVDHVASQLAVSKRTLQRRLQAENTNFQAVLQAVRTRLAKHYLKSDTISGIEISLLLGFESHNSFIRAFHQWTGNTPEEYRKCCQIVGE